MCVIFIADTERPSEEMVERGYKQNAFGAGVAWREEKMVHWKKGMTIEEAKEVAATLPLPYVLHFRIPTCGGSPPGLCHPFPVQRNAPLDLEGVTKGFVLFHNGHWNRWRETILDLAIKRQFQVPEGKWSDSRAMALLAAYLGVPSLEMVDEKIVAFSPTKCDVFGNGWSTVNGVYVSNTHWQTVSQTHHRTYDNTGYVMCREQRCTLSRKSNSMYCEAHQHLDPKNHKDKDTFNSTPPKSGGTSAADRFPVGGDEFQGGVDHPEEAQQGAKEVGGGNKGGKTHPSPLNGSSTRNWTRALNPKRFTASGSPTHPD